jgi:heme-degrading monooxygenase HmoA
MNRPEKILPLLSELNQRAKLQPGYVSTDTLQSTEDLGDYLVVSIWETMEDWNNWFRNPERKEIQDQVDSLIGERTFYEVFQPVSS